MAIDDGGGRLNPLTRQINRIKAALARETHAPLDLGTPPEFQAQPPEPPPPPDCDVLPPDLDDMPEPPDAPYHFSLVKTTPPPATNRDRPNIDFVRDMMRAEMAAYLSNPAPDHMLLVRATPGVGKTTAAVWAALEMARLGKRVQYAGPRHAFYDDILRAADRYGGEYNKFWEWLPRQDGDEGRIQHGPKRRTCQHCDAINGWMKKGYKGIDFCSGICGWDYVSGGCEYHAQKGRQEPVIFCQHAHVSLGHPLTFDVTIGDENPMGAFTHVRTIKAGDILGECPPGRFRQMLEAFIIIAAGGYQDGPDMIQALMKQSELDLPELIDVCKTASMPLDAVLRGMGPPKTAQEALDAPVWYTPDLVSLMLREFSALQDGRAQIPRVRVGGNQLTLYMRRSPTDRLPAHVIWLDATANEQIYKALFKRKIKLIKAEPAIEGRIFQVWNRANGKSSLIDVAMVDDGNDGTKKQVKLTDKADHANQLIESLVKRQSYKTPAVISFKDLAKKWEFTQEIERGHFYAARGSNAFESCDSIFIVGSPLPTLSAMKRTAGILFFERDAAFNVKWSRQNVRYNYVDDNGDGWAYPIGNFWGDPDLETIVTAYREEEIIHAAHRVRPVFQKTDVWLLTNIPIDDLPPCRLLSMGEVLSAPGGAHMFRFTKFVETIEQWDDEVITGKMIAERCKTSLPTAHKYLRMLADTSSDWELAAIRTGKRGPKSQGVRRAK